MLAFNLLPWRKKLNARKTFFKYFFLGVFVMFVAMFCLSLHNHISTNVARLKKTVQITINKLNHPKRDEVIPENHFENIRKLTYARIRLLSKFFKKNENSICYHYVLIQEKQCAIQALASSAEKLSAYFKKFNHEQFLQIRISHNALRNTFVPFYALIKMS